MQNPFSLEGKNVVITGASSGIGRQCAIACSHMGANVVLIARNEERLKETCLKLTSADYLYFSQDISIYDRLEPIISESVSKVGKISGFIHSAGIDMIIPFKSMKPEHYEKLFAVNVLSGFELAKIISQKKYFDNNGGAFVFISSVMGRIGQAGRVGYSSTKGALIAGVKSMALELASKKIRANCVLPGLVYSRMTNKLFETLSKDQITKIQHMHPLGLGNPEDIANTCTFLLSNAGRWITGSSLIVDGGYSSH